MAIFRIGITGHRHLDDLKKIMVEVDSAVESIQAIFPGSKFRILSALAEGTDQILAKRLLLLPDSVLWVPLPLPKEEYLKDFRTAQTREEFLSLFGKAERIISMPQTEKRADAYLAAGRFIVESSDLLLAVWDGEPARGKGGTAEVVDLARRRSLPIIWIHAGNSPDSTVGAAASGNKKGEVTFENFPSQLA